MTLIENPDFDCFRHRRGVPLMFVPCGNFVRVLCCNGRDPELERHLTAMGMGRGSLLKILGNENGRITVSSGDARIGLDAELARRIRVTQAENECACFQRERRFRKHGCIEAGKRLYENEEERKFEMPSIISAVAMHKGQSGIVKQVAGSGAVNRRLRDMGLTPGSTIRCEGKAPLGDPLEFEIKGYRLTLRKDEAEGIMVEVQT